jgi:hypothetical protein
MSAKNIISRLIIDNTIDGFELTKYTRESVYTLNLVADDTKQIFHANQRTKILDAVIEFTDGKTADRVITNLNDTANQILSVKEMRKKHGISDADRKGSYEEVEILSGKRITNDEA